MRARYRVLNDIELRTARLAQRIGGISAPRRRKSTLLVRQLRDEFCRNLISRTALSPLVPQGVDLAVRVTALDHKSADYPVELSAVVKAAQC